MLKWTASAQKLPQVAATMCTTPSQHLRSTARRINRRATIANKENIPMVTSTPMTRLRNSSPLLDILNATPEPPSTPERFRTNDRTRRHSTLGIAATVPKKTGGGYASTLPRYEEEYSPSTVLPTGQQLALRGLLPDPFLGNPRYFKTPEMTESKLAQKQTALPKKRKLEQEFTEIAQHAAAAAFSKSPEKMSDQTLDQLIDAILDSARKEEKKRKPRRSFNLRRRTLLRNQAETVQDLMLSPSYTPGVDPADDLSLDSGSTLVQVRHPTPQSTPPMLLTVTPQHLATPHHLPTPAATPALTTPSTPNPLPHPCKKPALNDTFMLATPVRTLAHKRPRQQQQPAVAARRASSGGIPSKRYKVNARNYFEIGLALPSIYV